MAILRNARLRLTSNHDGFVRPLKTYRELFPLIFLVLVRCKISS